MIRTESDPTPKVLVFGASLRADSLNRKLAALAARIAQLARGEGLVYDKASGRQLAERVKARGRVARAKKP